jgi:RNA-directed DNA polymerase
LCGTWEPVVPMLREKSKWKPHEGESTDAEHGGGAARSSEEAPVMGAERRGCIDRSYDLINHYLGGIIE